MNIIKQITAALIVMSFLFPTGCGSSPSSSSTQDELDIAIRDASDYLTDNIPGGHKIVILNIQSDYPDLSDYIIEELIANAVNDKNFLVVDRQQLDIIRAERDFQWSGEVNDSDAVEIGKTAGAQTIVSGAIGPFRDGYRLRIRALEVQTATVQGQYNRNLSASPALKDLVKTGGTKTAAAASSRTSASTAGGARGQTAQQPAASTQSPAPAQSTAPAESAAPALPTYRIGDIGPAGGLIFYDKGNNSGGWRYLEAAPNDLPNKLQFSSERVVFDDERAVGRGQSNTQAIMAEAAKRGGGFGWAAQACDALVVNGFDDWFLPSRDELHYMYGNLHLKGVGNFRDDWYWSSTGYAWSENFSNGSQRDAYFSDSNRVRAIRQIAGPNTGRSSVDDDSVIAGTTGSTGKPKRSSSNILYSILGVLLMGGLLGYIGYVVISNPDGGSSRTAAAMR